MDSEREGVIKFSLEHVDESPGNHLVSELDAWRSVFRQTGIIGQDPDRYEGYGFGNLSMRTDDGFLISGTQTGLLLRTSIDDYAEVVDWNPGLNIVCSRGRVRPSSESLSHGVVYETDPSVAAVFHVHSPEIWGAATQLGIPITDPVITYGTPEMAEAVASLVAASEAPGILSMGGHEDGVLAWGRDMQETGLLLIRCLVDARTVLVHQ